MVIHASLEAFVPVGGHSVGRHGDDLQAIETRVRSDDSRRLDTVHDWHLHIHQNKVIVFGLHHANGHLAVLGRYERGFEPNTGKNRYGLNLGWGVTYIPPNTQLEFDSAIGVTWSTRNPATDYKNGEAFTWEWAAGKFWSNGLKIGVAGYAYQQITGDSGPGARLGPFKGRVFGVCPHIVYDTELMRRPVILNLHNYQEFGAENRFEGNVTTFAATFKF